MQSENGTPEKCTICLAQVENRSVIDGCHHAFCYSCLKEWSKVKPVCPLCKNPFTFFMHNIRANDDFDRYQVPKPVQTPSDFNDHLQRFMHWESETNRVVDHWMSSRIHEWRERIQQDQENARAAIVAATSIELIRRRRKYYREGVQVSHVRNNKRIRDISSRFFRENPPQVHRLVPWLKRELIVLFGANNMMLVNRVCDLILSAVPTLGIRSTDFYDEIEPFFLDRTDHFLKEFIAFATSPHDLATYDSNARYTPTRHARENTAAWSSDEENGVRRPLPHLYNARFPEPPPLAYVRNRVSLERSRAANRRKPPVRVPPTLSRASPPPPSCIIISSPSASSDEGDVEFVKFIKPPHLRTPDAVINLSSEEEIPGPSHPRTPPSAPSVPPKLRHGSGSSDSSSDDSDVRVTLKSVVVPVTGKVAPSGILQQSSDTNDEFSMTSHFTRPEKWSSARGLSPSSPSSPSTQRPLRKVFERKRSNPDNDFARRFPRSWSSSSENSDDYASPYIPKRARPGARPERKRSK